MKMAVCSHWSGGPCITALTTLVTHSWPSAIESGGCSLTPRVGTTHETDGKVPFAAASKNSVFGRTFLNCFVTWTVLKPGSGFMMGFVLSSVGLLHGGLMQLSLPT